MQLLPRGSADVNNNPPRFFPFVFWQSYDILSLVIISFLLITFRLVKQKCDNEKLDSRQSTPRRRANLVPRVFFSLEIPL